MAGSLERLGLPRVTLLQLAQRRSRSSADDEPASITPADVLGPVADAFRRLQDEGLVQYLGLTGTGDASCDARGGAVRRVRHAPGAVQHPQSERGRLLELGRWRNGLRQHHRGLRGRRDGSVRDPRVRGGALLGQPPSAHTLRTPYFPLALYERDSRRAARLIERLGRQFSAIDLAVRFALSHPGISSAIIGFGSPAHVDQIASCHCRSTAARSISATRPRLITSDTRN